MNNTIIQSLARAIDILKCFENAEELGVTDISHKTGLHKSTAFNIISTLERYQFLEKNENTSKYRLGIELFRIGTKVNSDLRKIAIPYLDKLIFQFRETVNLVVRDGIYVTYLEKIESPYSMRISTTVGVRIPIHVTAVGKAILSGLTEDELHEVINQLTFKKLTENTIGDKKTLLEYINKVKRSGFSEDFEELEIGLTCVAAPIFNHTGKAFAAISISGPTSRMLDTLRKDISISLMESTQEISKNLGYKP